MIFQFWKKNNKKKKQKQKKQDDILFSLEYHVYWVQKNSCFQLFEDAKYGLNLFFDPKCWLEHFGDGKFSAFWSKVDVRSYFLKRGIPHLLISEKFLF